MHALAEKIQPLTAALKKLPLATASLSVRMLEKGVKPTNVGVRSVNVGLMCLFCDVFQHDDVCLPRKFLTGFNVSGIIEDSGVLRPQPPAGTTEQFWRTHVQAMRTNDAWACKVANQVSEQAKHASPRTKSLLRRDSEQTNQQTNDGIVGKGMTLAQLRMRYGSGPSMSCRVLRRHGIL